MFPDDNKGFSKAASFPLWIDAHPLIQGPTVPVTLWSANHVIISEHLSANTTSCALFGNSEDLFSQLEKMWWLFFSWTSCCYCCYSSLSGKKIGWWPAAVNIKNSILYAEHSTKHILHKCKGSPAMNVLRFIVWMHAYNVDTFESADGFFSWTPDCQWSKPLNN